MFNIAIFGFCIIKGYDVLNIYQQAHYQIMPYLKHFSLNMFYNILIPLMFLIPIAYNLDNIVRTILIVILLLYSVILFLLPKKRLKFSGRIIRILVFYLLLLSLVFLLQKPHSIVFVFIEFLVIPLYLIEIKISEVLNKKYITRAKLKLKEYKGRIIGITGSAGKTSTKFILYSLLKEFSTVITPDKSFNTPLGISKFINENDLNCDYIILEYGVSHIGDMDELLDIVKPDIAILTSILPMHIDDMKDIKHIINEKLKLVMAATVKILNLENDYIREVACFDNISYGINYGDNRCEIFNDYPNEFVAFDCVFKTKLVGREQILNTMAALLVLKILGFDMEVVSRIIYSLDNYNHRLEIKGQKHKIIDDTYNSNVIGFKMALEILAKQEGVKVLLTPGIVELGKYKKDVYNDLANYIINSCDVVILIGSNTRRLKYILKNYPIRLFNVQSFKSGYLLAERIIKDFESSCILIENDLPDLYKIGFRI